MKRALAVLVVLIALIFGFAVGAQAGPESRVWINIPFAFQAGDQVMPAGQYLFEFPRTGNFALGSLLKIVTQDGSICQHLLSRSIQGVTMEADWQVSFNKYGDVYFLTKIRNNDLGAEVSKTRKEKQMAAEFIQSLKPIAAVEVMATHSKAR